MLAEAVNKLVGFSRPPDCIVDHSGSTFPEKNNVETEPTHRRDVDSSVVRLLEEPLVD